MTQPIRQPLDHAFVANIRMENCFHILSFLIIEVCQ